jgi:hypothetical protein
MGTGSRRDLQAALAGSLQFSGALTAAVLVGGMSAALARSTTLCITTLPIQVTSEGAVRS